jgi:hypothetical protein
MTAWPAQRSMQLLKKHGWMYGKTEQWNPHAFKRQDLFGFIDILAVLSCNLGIQATTSSSVSSHVHKILDDDVLLHRVALWLAIPDNRFEIWGWSKKGKKGKRKLWTLRRVPFCFYLDALSPDIDDTTIESPHFIK